MVRNERNLWTKYPFVLRFRMAVCFMKYESCTRKHPDEQYTHTSTHFEFNLTNETKNRVLLLNYFFSFAAAAAATAAAVVAAVVCLTRARCSRAIQQHSLCIHFRVCCASLCVCVCCECEQEAHSKTELRQKKNMLNLLAVVNTGWLRRSDVSRCTWAGERLNEMQYNFTGVVKIVLLLRREIVDVSIDCRTDHPVSTNLTSNKRNTHFCLDFHLPNLNFNNNSEYWTDTSIREHIHNTFSHSTQLFVIPHRNTCAQWLTYRALVSSTLACAMRTHIASTGHSQQTIYCIDA